MSIVNFIPRVVRVSALLPIAFGVAAANQAMAAESLVYRINVGGGELVDSTGQVWSADFGFNDNANSNVSVSGYGQTIQGSAHSELYWAQRYDTWTDEELTYSLPVDNGDYKVKLYFAETYVGAYGKNMRRFNVLAETLPFFANMDIYKEVGGANIELVKTIDQVTVSDGQLDVLFEHVKNNPMLAGIEVFKLTSDAAPDTGTTDPVDTATVIARTNVGGGAFTDADGNAWSADSGYNDGEVSTSGNGKDIANTSNDTLFYTQRFSRSGDLVYSYDVNNGTYAVRLHLAETYSGNFWDNARVFNVVAEGTEVLSNIDMFKEAGSDTALVKNINDIVVTDGQLNLAFSHVIDNPMVAGIEVIMISEDTSGEVAPEPTPEPDPTPVVDTVSITQQPSSQFVTEGVRVDMSVAAEGSDAVNYQWYFNGAAISGATSATLSLGSVSVSDAGNYYCVVQSGTATETSSTATLSVSAAVQSYSVLISWTAPATRQDGSTLSSSEIKSYEIYHSTTSDGVMEKIQTVTSPSLDVNDLSAGTHYFALRAIDTDGLVSELSQKVTINF